jgi:hypothetical protein
MAFRTAQGSARIMHQPDLGRTGTEFDRLRMHASNYATTSLNAGEVLDGSSAIGKLTSG